MSVTRTMDAQLASVSGTKFRADVTVEAARSYVVNGETRHQGKQVTITTDELPGYRSAHRAGARAALGRGKLKCISRVCFVVGKRSPKPSHVVSTTWCLEKEY